MMKYPYSRKPLRLTKKDIKNTKKCIILENGLYEDKSMFIIRYESGISTGEARFVNSDMGIEKMKKFIKLLER